MNSVSLRRYFLVRSGTVYSQPPVSVPYVPIRFIGRTGVYWSSSPYSYESFSYNLSFDGVRAYPSSYDNFVRYSGYYLRCLAS